MTAKEAYYIDFNPFFFVENKTSFAIEVLEAVKFICFDLNLNVLFWIRIRPKKSSANFQDTNDCKNILRDLNVFKH